MAGPKAPIGTLSQHATQAAQLAKNVGSQSGKGRATAAAGSKHNVLKDESESESSDSDSDNEGEDFGEALRNLQSKASGAKQKAPEPSRTTVAKKEESSSEDSSSEESTSESDSESDSDDESEVKKSATKSNGAANVKTAHAADAKKSTPAAKKQEKADESSSEESSSEAESSSSEESESEDETEQADKKGTTKPAPKAQPQPSKPVSQTQKAVSRPSESSEEEEDESSSEEEADESMAIDQRNKSGELSRIPEVISNEFYLRKAEDGANAAEVAKFFSEAKQQGKQIWYFTAPASIPIEVVEKLEIPLDRAQKGQSILSHNGDDYGVAFEDASTARTIKLVIPNKNGDQYRMTNGSVDQIMHLKRVTQFSQGGESLLSLSQTTHTVPPRQPRPQPPNLKARFQPFGAPSASGDDEDVDMADAPPPSSQKTPAKAKDDKKNKRKLEAETPKADSGKKSKKAKVEKETPSSASKPVKQTPIVPPRVPSFSAGKKETPIPLPPTFRRMSTSESAKSPEPAVKPAEEKKSKAKTTKNASKPKADDSASRAKKTTPVPLPPIAGAS
jgi:hypothetical protein